MCVYAGGEGFDISNKPCERTQSNYIVRFYIVHTTFISNDIPIGLKLSAKHFLRLFKLLFA